MNFEKVKKEINRLMKDKKMSSLIALIVILGIIFLVTSFFMKDNKDEVNKTEGTLSVNAKEEGTNGKKDVELLNEYEREQREQLNSILRKIEGVGEVDTMMTFESGEVKVPAYDNNTQTTTTEEEDSQGGKRVNEQKNDGSKVVMSTNGNGNEPFVTKVYKPKVVGVVVTAQGANNSKVKYNIEKAVSDLYNLSFDKVNVYPMVDKHIN